MSPRSNGLKKICTISPNWRLHISIALLVGFTSTLCWAKKPICNETLDTQPSLFSSDVRVTRKIKKQPPKLFEGQFLGGIRRFIRLAQSGLSPLRSQQFLGKKVEGIQELGTITTVKNRKKSKNQIFYINDKAAIEAMMRDTDPKLWQRDFGGNLIFQHVFGKGLAFSTGKRWQLARKTMTEQFNTSNAENLITGITDSVTALELRIEQSAKIGEEVNLTDELSYMTFDALLRALFSKRLSRGGELEGAVEEWRYILQQMGKSFLKPSLKLTDKLKDANKKIEGLIDQIISERLQNPNPESKDLLDLLLTAKRDNGRVVWTKPQVKNEIKLLFLAGFETTSLTLQWAMHFLHHFPGYQTHLAREAQEFFASTDMHNLNIKEVGQKLQFTKAVMKETLRLFPAAYFNIRVPNRNIVINGYRIPKGSFIMLGISANQRDGTAWKYPEIFDPNRFLWADAKQKEQSCAFMPFGLGNRICIGRMMSELETVLALARIFSRFQFVKTTGKLDKKLRPEDIGHAAPTITNALREANKGVFSSRQ